jgi:hypothetical protein
MKKKKVGDDEKAKSYVCKGESNLILPTVIGISKIDVKAYHTKYWEVNAQVIKEVNMDCQNGSSLITKAKTKTKTWTEKVCIDILEKFQPECNTIHSYHIDVKPSDSLIASYKKSHQDIFLYFFKCLGKGAKKINETIIRDMFAGVMNFIISQNDEAHNAYGLKMYKGLFPHLI